MILVQQLGKKNGIPSRNAMLFIRRKPIIVSLLSYFFSKLLLFKMLITVNQLNIFHKSMMSNFSNNVLELI